MKTKHEVTTLHARPASGKPTLPAFCRTRLLYLIAFAGIGVVVCRFLSHVLHWSAATVEVTLVAACLLFGARAAAGAKLWRERALEELNIKAAQKSDELKAAMLDALAHDIKTPLTSIKASISSLLSERSSTDRQRELLSIINEETDNLDRIINETIEIAQIEFLDLKLERRCYDVKETIEAALLDLNHAAAKRLRVDIPEGLPPVSIDFRLAKVVLRQLVHNALKYSSEASPVLISAVQSSGQIILRVKDSGFGIAPAKQSLVFNRHYRTGEGCYQANGTGMGLAIAKRIIDAHGGQIGLASRPGEGCVFHIALPISQES